MAALPMCLPCVTYVTTLNLRVLETGEKTSQSCREKALCELGPLLT